jgi:hypothetical protein
MTDAISRVSETMARCSDIIGGEERRRTGTDG